MKIIFLTLIICAFTWFSTVHADEAQHRSLAEELLDIMEVQNLWNDSEDIVKDILSEAMNDMDSTEDAFTEEHKNEMIKLYDTMVKVVSWEGIKDEYINYYTKTFTQEELSNLITFFNSPVGRKYTKVQPELSRRIMQYYDKEVMPKLDKIAVDYKAEVQKSINESLIETQMTLDEPHDEQK